MNEMTAVIMAGGQGTRLRPLTSNQPKPMVPLANRPMMEHVIRLLAKHGFEDVVVTLQFLPTVITNYFGDGEGWGVRIKYVTEESPLGTAGGVLNAERHLDNPFVVVSGDALTDIDLADAAGFHRENQAAVTIVLKKVPNPLEFGIVITDENHRIVKFLEKPGWGQVFSDTINTGIYIIEPEMLDFIPDDRPYDFAKELFPDLLEKEYPLFGYVADGYWCDVGNLEQYVGSHKDILDGLVEIEIPGHRMDENVWIGDGVELDDSVELSGKVLIGNHVKVEGSTKLREYTVLGNNVVVKRGNFLHRSVIMDNSYLGPSCHIRGSVIGRNCDVKKGVRADEGSVIGDDCLIGDEAIINPDVLVYPFKTVDSRATVNSSVIWESRGARSLFGRRGVSGLINVDITPEKALKLGMAYGSTLPVDSQVVTSRDGTRSARIIKRAFMAGLNATGVHIRDLEVNAVPVNKFTVDSYNNEGGVDFRTFDRDPQWIQINFFDEESLDLDQGARRKIEGIYNRNDFRRAFLNELGEIFYPARAREAYVQSLGEHLDFELIRARGFKIVLDYNYGAGSFILPGLLGKLGCEVMSLNAYTDESKTMTSRPPVEKSLSKLGEVVKSFSADLGFLFDNGAEQLHIVDSEGKPLSDMQMLAVVLELLTRREEGGIVAVPVNEPSLVEQIAEARGFEVIRTRADRSSLMSAAYSRGVVFAGSSEAGFIFPDFIPTFDAMMSMGKVLELLASEKETVKDVLSKTPPFSIMQSEVFTSWDDKGMVMRALLEKHQGGDLDSTDGIKLHRGKGRWLLILPDEEEPVLHLYAEGEDVEDCRRMLEQGEKEIENMTA